MNDSPSYAESHLRHSATQAGTPAGGDFYFISAAALRPAAARKYTLLFPAGRLDGAGQGFTPARPRNAGGEEREK